MANRQGTLVWKGKQIVWQYERFKDSATFELVPHFKLTAIDPDTKESVTWPSVTIDLDELKGIEDFTKLPKELMAGICDNAVAKLNETEPELTRIQVPTNTLLGHQQ